MFPKCLLYFLALLLWLSPAVLAMGEKAVPPSKDAQLEAALASGRPVIVKLGANWCGPCRAMKPIIKELAAEQKGKITVLDLDIDEHRALAQQFKVNLIPTIIFFDKQGKAVGKVTGYMDKQALLTKINELGLDK